MQLGQFDLFCQVARVKSFSKAAKLLHISQPAISAQIHSMEEYYGIKLFERTPHGVILTEAGATLFEYAKQILELHEDLERKLSSIADEKNQRLIIGATATVGSHALACGIWTFKDKYPELQINLEIGSLQEMIAKIYDKTIDLAIIECPVANYKGITKKSVFTDELVAIVPNNEQWAGKTSVTIEELTKSRLILPEEGSELHYILDQALEPLNLKFVNLKPRITISNSNAIKSAVEKGHGVSICLRLTVQKELRHGTLLALPIENIAQSVEYNLVYRDADLSGIAKRFIRFITLPGELEVC
ncbi:LysR family transcriptional regulator [Sporolituus thermophilus]|uniref:Transcriptional regulator, LysR family n=1 Tax=Sporolituus thermophilus DSM 23256 TaxID=1123285 RepID=A0A1G7I9L7_9FIRM|nr:LysR family transcriptional regulator [Sporolituus thermophilus]SDF09382.1 transcriptional regulator, LysR family [Sporolituus thermophilus DSM 23256]